MLFTPTYDLRFENNEHSCGEHARLNKENTLNQITSPLQPGSQGFEVVDLQDVLF